jgi:hypothetical protein
VSGINFENISSELVKETNTQNLGKGEKNRVIQKILIGLADRAQT